MKKKIKTCKKDKKMQITDSVTNEEREEIDKKEGFNKKEELMMKILFVIMPFSIVLAIYLLFTVIILPTVQLQKKIMDDRKNKCPLCGEETTRTIDCVFKCDLDETDMGEYERIYVYKNNANQFLIELE